MDASFGDLVRQARRAANVTQEELAGRAGLSVRGISDLERGVNRAPRKDTLELLAAALSLSADERGRWERARRQFAGPTHHSDVSEVPASRRPYSGLPAPRTAFIGREREISELTALLPSTRLLTLTGAGGCGKTRLALEIASRVAEHYADGVWFVDLAPLTDPALVLPAIAQVLGVREDAVRPLATTLTDALRARQLLLVLDNCEHFIEVCATMADMLLRTCPQVQFLATSREALRVPGETAWRVPSLSLPGPQTVPALETLTQSESVRLFADRATAVQPHFALTQANAQAVTQICRELDGIPLALELAAARMSTLTAEEIAARLVQRFRLLTGGSRTALPRQQTLKATVDWSYDLLTPEEQLLFARLSVFAGGWALDAAEAVGAGQGIATEAVLDLLTRLAEKSLVVAEALEGGTSRYRLLETLRQYGRESLQTRGESTRAQQQHAMYFLTLAERAEPELSGPAQLRWFDQLEREHDNLRAALTWWLERAEHGERDEASPAAAAGLRLAGALFWFWFVHDHHPEALDWLERALVQGTAADAAMRAKALFGAGIFAWSMNDLARSAALLTQSVDISRSAGDSRMYVLALGSLGFTLSQNGLDEQGVVAVEESIVVARELGEPWLLAYALLHRLLRVAYGPAIEWDAERNRATAAGEEAHPLFQVAGDGMCIAEVQLCLGELALYEADYERAEAAFRAALPMMRAVGWRTSVADGLVRLGDVARKQGNIEEATSLYLEALTLYRQSGRRLGANLVAHVPAVLCHLAEMALEQGDWTTAHSFIVESLTITRDMGDESSPQLPEALEVRAALSAVQCAPLDAMRLAGAAAALRVQYNAPLTASEQATLERRLSTARQPLTAEQQAEAWAAGQRMTPEQAIADAVR